MRIVVDTNVLIASLISRGFCHELMEHCFLNHTIVTSEFILDELLSKLVEKFKYSTESAEVAVELFSSRMEIVSLEPLTSPVTIDPDDDNILATALAGKCVCLITGDRDLLVLKEFSSIKIFSPRQFSDNESNITG